MLRLKNLALRPTLRQRPRRHYHSEHGGIYGHRPAPRFPPNTSNTIAGDRSKNSAPNFTRLVTAYREHGHRVAQVDLLQDDQHPQEEVPELVHSRYNLEPVFSPEGTLSHASLGAEQKETSLGVALLKETYANRVGYEFMHMEEEGEREWFAQRIEQLATLTPSPQEKVDIALELARSQNFDHFLAKKFQTVKRYGGEGCESMMAFFLQLVDSSPENGIDHIIIGMAHRGRLNLLTGLLKLPPVRVFQKMKGLPEFPPTAKASGDVLSHLFTTVDLEGRGGPVRVGMLPNPSHLETVNPMAVGKVRAKLKTLGAYDYSNADSKEENLPPSRVLCVQVHGDAALAGQGINQETLGFAYVPHYRVGGSLHLVVNNQVGYTTPAERAKSSRYNSDVAKMIGAPVIHVNGDYPEEVWKATKLALEFRSKFHKDVFIDLICFRRWGHNELDDPTFTNPLIYQKIHARKSIPDVYCENLIAQGILSQSTLTSSLEQHNAELNSHLDQVESYSPSQTYLKGRWEGIVQPEEAISTWDTGLEVPLLQYIAVKSVQFPETFNVHSHLLKTFMKTRLSRVGAGEGSSVGRIDWATAEAMAIGSLLYQGYGVRLSGEDVGRGTFSQRHAMLVDQKLGEIFIPLNDLCENQAQRLEVCNSTLSEEAVLSLEYGFSLESPDNLVIWEAQFGDFFNGAQIPIDTLISSGETKWMLQSGIVLLLPHGMDGAGPEHSSCRIERFLQLTDSREDAVVDGDGVNLQVANPTTPAQYFHLLRRQMIRNFRKPLVVAAPKVLLRLPAASSTLEEMGPSTTFLPVLDDPDCPDAQQNKVKRLIFVSGRHYYTLKEAQAQMKRDNVAIIRLESLAPFPALQLQKIVQKYKAADDCVWSQEEHQNMGAWSFVKPRFENFIGRRIRYVGRGPLATPAVGVSQVHKKEVEKLIKDTFA